MAGVMMAQDSGEEQQRKQIVRLPNSAGNKLEVDPVASIETALGKGLSFLDVTNVLGSAGVGEIINRRRSDLTLAVRFGKRKGDDGVAVADASAMRVREVCEEAVAELGVKSIDFFYQVVADPNTPVEETATELKALVKRGLVKSVGLAVADAGSLMKAHAIQPVAAVAVNWSVFNPTVSTELLNKCGELGVAVLATQPLAGSILVAKCFNSKLVGKRVSTLLENHRAKMVQKLKKIRERPNTVLAERVSAIVQAQRENLTKKVVKKLNRQDKNLLSQVEAALKGEKPGLLRKLTELSAEQKDHMVEGLTKLISRQSNRLMARVDKLIERPHEKLMIMLDKAFDHQKGVLANRALLLHNRKAEALITKLKNRLGEDSKLVTDVEKILTRQDKNLARWITNLKDMQAERLSGRAEKIHGREMAAATTRMHNVLERQGKQITSKIQNVLGKRKAEAPCIEKKLKRQREMLENRISKMFEKGATGKRIEAVVGKVMEKHAQQSVTMVEKVVKRCTVKTLKRFIKNNKPSTPVKAVTASDVVDGTVTVADPKEKTLKNGVQDCTPEDVKNRPVAGRVHDENRMQEILSVAKQTKKLARIHGKKPRSIALAWLRAQGDNVIPVVQFGGGKNFFDMLLDSTTINLTKEEIDSLGNNKRGNVDEGVLDVKEDWDVI